jgi:hypothetical protein
MLFLTEYELKPTLVPSDTKRLMDEFAKRGAAPGELAHYVRADGKGGYTLTEVDEIGSAYETVLAYTEFMSFTITPLLKVDDAVGPILASIQD